MKQVNPEGVDWEGGGDYGSRQKGRVSHIFNNHYLMLLRLFLML